MNNSTKYFKSFVIEILIPEKKKKNLIYNKFKFIYKLTYQNLIQVNLIS